MKVSKQQAMQMFDHDLDIMMDDLRGMQAHYQIAEWEAFIFLRKPDYPESYVVKYAAASDEFAKQIVELHRQPRASVAAPPPRELYSELIHIAAELVGADGFLSPCGEDLAPKLKRADLLKTAERQDESLKDWAMRVRRVADELSSATVTVPPPDWLRDAGAILCVNDPGAGARVEIRFAELTDAQELHKALLQARDPSPVAVTVDAETKAKEIVDAYKQRITQLPPVAGEVVPCRKWLEMRLRIAFDHLGSAAVGEQEDKNSVDKDSY